MNGNIQFPAAARLACLLAVLPVAVTPAAAASGDSPDFLRDVRPILSSHCFKCHGPDAESRKGGLRLDVREEALKAAKSGHAAVVPGKPEASSLVARIFTEDADDVMPPTATKHPLSGKEKEILRRWVASGAEYRPHWAFVKPSSPRPPGVKLPGWQANPIDAFVLDRMLQKGLQPSPPADRHTLVRRVYLDLIGLPPTPEQADAFVNDASPEAFTKLVDQLLASPHYGERWARRWLDLARYSDTNGYEKDRPRSIWAYRDWVIRAFNSGMPFDQFTIEQIAGDLQASPGARSGLANGSIDPRDLDLLVATGFHRNTMINEEGGADPQEFRFHSMVDRVHVTATAWLGLTMACAQCHTHKYDPIQHTEYYQFMAFMNNADEPWIDVPTPETASRRKEIQGKIARLETELASKFPPEFQVDWISPAVARFQSESATSANRLADGSFLLEGKAADKDTYTVTLDTHERSLTHLQLSVLPDTSLVQNGPGRSEGGNFVLSEIQVTAVPLGAGGEPVKVELKRAWADASQKDFPGHAAADGREDTGWAVDTGGAWHVPRTLTMELAGPAGFDSGTRFTVRLVQNYGGRHVIGRFRLCLGRVLPDTRPMDVRRLEHLNHRLDRWIASESRSLTGWTPISPIAAKGSHPTLNIEADNTIFVSGDFTKSDTYTVDFQGNWKGVRAIRIEALPDDRLPNGGPGRVHYEGPFGDFFMSDVKLFAGDQPARIQSALDSYHSGGSDASKAIDNDLQSGWSISGGQGRAHSAVFILERPMETEGRLRLEMIFERYYAAGLGRFRVWVTRDAQPLPSALPNEVQSALLALKSSPTGPEAETHRARLRSHFATVAAELAVEREEIESLRRSLPKHPTTLVMLEREPGHTRSTRLHKRGEFLQPKEEVTPGVPGFLPALPPGAPTNRLTFARWLVSTENPLTARVVMNREWQAFFGRGIVRTLEDFGFQGELPTHPELLDWLATEFMRRGWSLKEMHRLIVGSATYQQASTVTPGGLEKDPENLLWSRGPRFRMEAEQVRDAALVASGLLSPAVGGPSVFPPQLASITTEGAYGPLTWTASTGADRYRRSLYTFSKRTTPFAMFNVFDGPSGEACVARRDRSNTPLQSLTLLNDEAFLEMARALGRKALTTAGTREDRMRWMFRRCLTRPPTADELPRLLAFLERQQGRLASGELKAEEIMGGREGEKLEEQAAWTAVARVLMNLDETITKG